jgi:hypothetical protein
MDAMDRNSLNLSLYLHCVGGCQSEINGKRNTIEKTDLKYLLLGGGRLAGSEH